MADAKDMPNAEAIQKRDFRLVTKTGNELIKTITTTKDTVGHPEIIKDGLEAAVREYISIIVEKSDLNDLVNTKDEYKFLGSLDVKSIFEEKVGRKNPTTEKTNHLAQLSVNNQEKILRKLEAIDRLDQVSLIINKILLTAPKLAPFLDAKII